MMDNVQELREIVNPVFDTAKSCIQLDAAAGDERFPISQYMAALLPYEPHYSEIIGRIQAAQKVRGDE